MEMESVSDDDLIHLDLFSGIGGFALAARWVGGIRTIGFCDVEDYACKTLEKNFKGIPIFRDVRKLHPDGIIPRDGRIDFITAGFPCQDLSVAGNQAGIEADRSGLFFEIMRLSDEILAYCGVRPALVLENVSNILAGDGGSWARTVYGELACRGYCVEWKIVSASDVGAPHQRKRWWCIAYVADSEGKLSNVIDHFSRDSMGRKQAFKSGNGSGETDMADSSLQFLDSLHDEGSKEGGSKTSSQRTGDSCNKDVSQVADSNGTGCKERRGTESVQSESVTAECGSEDVSDSDCKGWKKRKGETGQGIFRTITSNRETTSARESERGLGGMADGIPDWLDEPGDIPRVTTGQKNRVARLKGLGNAVVPQCAMIPLMRLKEIYHGGI